jgi:transcriptional regulator with XRE-family HTH domain
VRTHIDTSSKARALGQVLREIRHNRNWSLKDFEVASQGQIKDVVLGSYERGSRSISVSKLETIAAIYEIPISAFFAKEKIRTFSEDHRRVIIDLRKLSRTLEISNSDAATLLDQFTRSVINLRRDWNGEILSLRSSDITLLSMMSSTAIEYFENFYLTRD